MVTPEQRYATWDRGYPTKNLGYFAEDLEPELVKLAILKGADVNEANFNGLAIRHPSARPLLRAAYKWTQLMRNPVMNKRGEETVKELLRAGADPNLPGITRPTIAGEPFLAQNPGLQKLFGMIRPGKLRGLYIEKALGPSPLPDDVIGKIAEMDTGLKTKKRLSPETLAEFKKLGYIAPKKTAGRRFTRKQCKKFKCAKMGFTQKASCRPYKNCYRSRKSRK